MEHLIWDSLFMTKLSQLCLLPCNFQLWGWEWHSISTDFMSLAKLRRSTHHELKQFHETERKRVEIWHFLSQILHSYFSFREVTSFPAVTPATLYSSMIILAAGLLARECDGIHRYICTVSKGLSYCCPQVSCMYRWWPCKWTSVAWQLRCTMLGTCSDSDKQDVPVLPGMQALCVQQIWHTLDTLSFHRVLSVSSAPD